MFWQGQKSIRSSLEKWSFSVNFSNRCFSKKKGDVSFFFFVYRLLDRDRLRRLFFDDFLRSREPSRSRLILRFRAFRSFASLSSLSFSLRRSLPRDLLRSFILLLSFFDLSFERDLDRLSLRDFFLSSSFRDFRSFDLDLERDLLLLLDLLLERLLERLLDEPESDSESYDDREE